VLTSPSILEPEVLEEEDRMEEEEEGGEEYDDESRNGDEQQVQQLTSAKYKGLITRASLASVSSRPTLSFLTGSGSTSSVSARSLSSASSARSQRTVGKSVASSSIASRLNVNTPSTPRSTISPHSSSSRPPHISTTAAISRPTSSLSSTTDSTAAYRTASPEGGGGLHTSTRSRRTSGASTISIRTTPSCGDDKLSPVSDRTRRISVASVGSVASNTGSVETTGGAAAAMTMSTGKFVGGGGVTPPPPLLDPKNLSPASVPRPGSIHSSISGGLTASNNSFRRVVRKMVPKKKSSAVRSYRLLLRCQLKNWR
jgi:hypothetical protein